MKVGIVGLGYVGLPLAVAFGEAATTWWASTLDARKITALQRWRELHRGRARRAPGGDRHALLRHRALRRPLPLRRRGHRGAHAAHPQPRARPRALVSCGQLGRGTRAPARSARGARVHDLSGHHARAAGPAARGVRPRRRQGLQPRLLARAHRPGPHRLHDAHHAEGRRRATPRRASSARSSSTARSATRSWRSPLPRRPSSPSCWRTSSAR